MNNLRGVVRVIDPKKVDGEFVLAGKLGTLLIEFSGRDNGLWVGTNGWDEPGAHVSLDGLKSLLSKLETRATSKKPDPGKRSQ